METLSPPPVSEFARSLAVTPWARSVVTIDASAECAGTMTPRPIKARIRMRRMCPSQSLPRDMTVYNTSLPALQEAQKK